MQEGKRGLILKIDSWRTPATIYPRKRCGDFRIADASYKKGNIFELNGIKGYNYFVCGETLHLTVLEERTKKGWKTWMIDSPVEWYGNKDFAEWVDGDNVLIAGLGLGLIIHRLVELKRNFNITVVEIAQEIIDLVEKYLPIEVEMICGNFHKILPELPEFDTVIADMWTGKGSDCGADMTQTIQELNEHQPSATKLIWGMKYWQKPQGPITFQPCFKCCKTPRSAAYGRICMDCYDLKLG